MTSLQRWCRCKKEDGLWPMAGHYGVARILRTPAPATRFKVIAIELFGPLPLTKTGNKWIFIVEHTASKWVKLFTLKSTTAEACAKILIEEIITRYGVPRKVISDNGVQFISSVMQKMTHCAGISQCLTPHHPASNPVERKKSGPEDSTGDPSRRPT